jgi:hypothetical protein
LSTVVFGFPAVESCFAPDFAGAAAFESSSGKGLPCWPPAGFGAGFGADGGAALCATSAGVAAASHKPAKTTPRNHRIEEFPSKSNPMSHKLFRDYRSAPPNVTMRFWDIL